MNPDDEADALAYQEELELRQRADQYAAEYTQWLVELEQELDHICPRE